MWHRHDTDVDAYKNETSIKPFFVSLKEKKIQKLGYKYIMSIYAF